MAGYIPQNLLDEILDRVDIVELISGYFPLKRAGRNFKALCPFHHEKTPSFMINPQRQIFHCFGCGKGGNAFGFLVEYERMDFLEAVKTLAAKTGVDLPQPGSASGTSGIINNLYKINELACDFYKNILNSSQGASARQYLHKRNIKPQTLGFFRLGLSVDKWEGLFSYLRNKNINLSLLEKSGLICPRQEGGYYDRFRKRIIFPIFDVKNRVVAFGARLLIDDSSVAKYINSPESLIYVKGRHLYGLNVTREAIRQGDCAIVVEGYFDCITVYQAGIKNVVASLGTSLTSDQIRLLKRYTQNVVIVYDSDQAGEAATLRSLDMFIQEGINVRVAILPPNYDPDSFVRKFGSESFVKRINNAKSLFDYKLDLLNSRYDKNRPEGKACIAQEMLISLNYFKDAVLQSEYVRRLAHSLDVKEEALVIELKKIKGKNLYNDTVFIRTAPLTINPTERLLINLVLKETELVNQLRCTLSAEDFQDERIARVFSVICDLISQGQDIHPNRLIGYLNDPGSVAIVSELLAVDDEYPLRDSEKILQDCVDRIKKRRLSSKCELLQKQIKIAQQQGDHAQLNRLVEEFRDLQRLRVC
jgi:DNA primase